MALRYPYAQSAQLLYWPAHGPAFFDGWTEADKANEDLLCAEMSRLAYADRPTVEAKLSAGGFEFKQWIGGETREQRGATDGTDGFIAVRSDGQVAVLAFRGTESNKPEDILTDAMTASVPWKHGGEVHRGFARAYGLVRDKIVEALKQAPGRLLITGHSLGAGIATLAAADLTERDRMLITFGSPRVGNETFVNGLAGLAVHRYINCCDMVTRIPPEKFDVPNIETFVVELIPAHLRPGVFAEHLIKAVAVGLAGVLTLLHVQPEYKHVSEPKYYDRDGLQAPFSTRARDQQSARENYEGSFTPKLPQLLRQFATAVLAAGEDHDPAAVRAAIRDFAARLFQGDPVPLRDLADHAPLNYVSLITGRQ
jgi:pimeloyl-ACP methyl ester carboxylesterase